MDAGKLLRQAVRKTQAWCLCIACCKRALNQMSAPLAGVRGLVEQAAGWDTSTVAWPTRTLTHKVFRSTEVREYGMCRISSWGR